MRWWFLLPFPTAVMAQAPEVPPDRTYVPSAEVAISMLSCESGAHHVNKVMSGQRVNPAFSDLTCVVYTTRADSTLDSVGEYRRGRPSGTWYTFDAHERVTKVVDYLPDSTQWTYWYELEGRLTSFCHVTNCPDVVFDRIFGGGCPGQCWVLDKEQRLVQSYGTDTSGLFVQTWYYPDGQLAARTTSTDGTSIQEQWCPSGKRIGFLQVTSNGSSTVTSMNGRIVLWSVSEHAYYVHAVRAGQHKLRRLPWGRWRRYDERTIRERDEELQLRSVVYSDPDRPVELPCHLPKR